MILVYLTWFAATLLIMPFLGSLYLRGTAALTGGRWYLGIEPSLDRIHRWAWVGLLAVAGTAFLYPTFAYWFAPAEGHLAELLEHRSLWFNPTGIAVRGILYLAVFGAVAIFLPRLPESGRRFAGPGLIFLTLLLFAFAVDWLMVRDARWFSSAFPFLFILLCVLSALAGAILLTPLAALEEPVRRRLASLFQANAVLVAYIALMEFLIIWMGDLPREAQFYVERGRWLPAGMTLVGVVLPFLGLLPHDARQRPRRLRLAAACTLVGVALYLFWFIDPLNPGNAR